MRKMDSHKNILGFVLSARHGNCHDFASFLLPSDQIIALGDMRLEPCSNCDYECFKNSQCPKSDDIKIAYDAWIKSDYMLLLSPVYDGRPPSLYYIFEERTPSLWMRSAQGFGKFGNKKAAIVVVGNQDSEKTMGVLKISLENFGVCVKSSLIIRPNKCKTGGGIRGGLVQNIEVQEKLKNLLSELVG